MTHYEVWSITTANMYAKTFTGLEEAREALRRSRETWPNDEFGIIKHDGEEAEWLDEETEREAQAGGEGEPDAE